MFARECGHGAVLQVGMQFDLVGGDVGRADRVDRLRIKGIVKFETPIARVRPSSRASSSAAIDSATGTAAFGDGQWIRVRSSCSRRSFAGSPSGSGSMRRRPGARSRSWW
jgi:hypothetical protein